MTGFAFCTCLMIGLSLTVRPKVPNVADSAPAKPSCDNEIREAYHIMMRLMTEGIEEPKPFVPRPEDAPCLTDKQKEEVGARVSTLFHHLDIMEFLKYELDAGIQRVNKEIDACVISARYCGLLSPLYFPSDSPCMTEQEQATYAPQITELNQRLDKLMSDLQRQLDQTDEAMEETTTPKKVVAAVPPVLADPRPLEQIQHRRLLRQHEFNAA
jgi:hypothetical protein